MYNVVAVQILDSLNSSAEVQDDSVGAGVWIHRIMWHFKSFQTEHMTMQRRNWCHKAIPWKKTIGIKLKQKVNRHRWKGLIFELTITGHVIQEPTQPPSHSEAVRWNQDQRISCYWLWSHLKMCGRSAGIIEPGSLSCGSLSKAWRMSKEVTRSNCDVTKCARGPSI